MMVRNYKNETQVVKEIYNNPLTNFLSITHRATFLHSKRKQSEFLKRETLFIYFLCNCFWMKDSRRLFCDKKYFICLH